MVTEGNKNGLMKPGPFKAIEALKSAKHYPSLSDASSLPKEKLSLKLSTLRTYYPRTGQIDPGTCGAKFLTTGT
jgi:hypothetical protein